MHRYPETFDSLDNGPCEAWQDHPGVIARPPWIVAAFLAAGLVADHFVPAPVLYSPVQYLGGAGMLIAAFSLMAAALHALRSAGTPVETWRPTRRIISTGPYGGTRNPVYMAMLLGFIGVGMLANAPAVIALTPLLFAVLHFGVVLREEHYLECKFGDAYLDYRHRVARWV